MSIDAPPSLSIIAPVLNEANTIADFLQSARQACDGRVELIVVDGGSIDETVNLARPFCDHLVNSPKGRAFQMNAGARMATGTLLWFVHADSRLPLHADSLIRQALRSTSRRWGRFDIRLSGRHPLLRVVERMMNWRSRLTGIATGDQGLFITRELFESIGGFPQIALMEDIAISKTLRTHSWPVRIRQTLATSSRRWEHNGILHTIVLMWKLRLLYFLGADPSTLAKLYSRRDD